MTVISLIGMPGVGKSTLGAALAASLALEFVDTDRLIECSEGCSLQDIVDRQGYLQLRDIEARILLGLNCEQAVVATGGSAVYSAPAMAHLRQLGRVVYLQAGLDTLERRIDNFEARGLARSPGQSLAGLYAERTPLYERYADATIDCDAASPDASLAALKALL